MTTDTLKIAIVQFAPVWENPLESRFKLDQLLAEVPSDCDLIVLPEAFNTGFSMEAEKVSETMEGNTISWMKKASSEKNMAICGSLFIHESGSYFNRFCWVEPNGDIKTYDKRHLFSMGSEDKTYTNGKNQLLIDFKGWMIFPQICYDLRFPVWSRNTSDYHLLIYVANWPSARAEVWKTLLKARAIENQCFVVAANRVGTDGMALIYQGDSMVIDFKGNCISDATDGEKVLIMELDKSSLLRFREKFDTLKDADAFVLNV
jgi:predicted amidohydrolase